MSKKAIQLELFKDGIENPIEMTTGEIHLGKFPIFCISTNKPTDTRAVYEETRTLPDGLMGRRWEVNVDAYLGWPGQHDAEVWRALEHILHLRRSFQSNPFITSFAEIRKHMASRGVGKATWDRIEESLSRLASVKIRTDFWYHADEEMRGTAELHILDGFKVLHKQLANGQKRRSGVKIRLSPEIYTNIVERYVRPLDKGFRDSMKRWLSRRLYEFLSSMFYGVRDKGGVYRTRYTRLCALLGSKPQPYLSYARRVLGRAHEELQEQGFLEKVEWYGTRGESTDWVLVYYPGPVAIAQVEKLYWKVPESQQAMLFVEEVSPEDTGERVWVEEVDESDVSGEFNVETVEVEDKVEEGLQVASVLKVFEKHTGEPRRMRRLSEAERELLEEWRKAGVSLEEVDCGVWRAVEQEFNIARHAKRALRSIWSLDYCAWAVWAEFNVRKAKEMHVEGDIEEEDIEEEKRSTDFDIEPQEEEWWSKIRKQLRGVLNAKNFESYVEPLRLLELRDDQVKLQVPDLFFKSYFDDKYGRLVEQLFTELMKREVSLCYQVRKPLPA